ncbi:hypothetical protein [Morganella psychrotolerans]|nr:hypothetical protein [Morganella psychrotolerans]
MIKWIEDRIDGKPVDDAGIQDEIRQFFRQFFNVNLTDAQMRDILSLDVNTAGKSTDK